ncbi:hypothetical protein Bca101_009475 [Brassica carinata]
MGLHNLIRISNYFDEDFVEVMSHTNFSNEDFENNPYDLETTKMADGNHMMNIRDNIADMLWANH